MDPEATPTLAPQHLRALARANEVRLARARLKQRITQGEITVAEVILNTPWQVHSMPVLELLMSQRRWGLTRCRKFLQGIPISEGKTIGSMTDRQRTAVARSLCSLSASASADAPRPSRQLTHAV